MVEADIKATTCKRFLKESDFKVSSESPEAFQKNLNNLVREIVKDAKQIAEDKKKKTITQEHIDKAFELRKKAE